MPEHSPEPWVLQEDAQDEYTHTITAPCGNDKGFIADIVRLANAEANAERIVACVNHLAGIPTATLVKVGEFSAMFPMEPTEEFCENYMELLTGRKCKVEFIDEGSDR